MGELVNKTETDNYERITGGAKDDLFIAMLHGKDYTEKIQTSRGEFVVKYPRQKDMMNIGCLMSFNRKGLASTCFDAFTESRNLICSTLNVLVIKGPSWFENARKETAGFAWEEVPDSTFCEELYGLVYTFRTEVQKDFEKTSGSESVGVSAGNGNAETVDDGAFSGLAGSTGGN